MEAMDTRTKPEILPPPISRELRERLGLSLDEAGRRASIERSRLSRYERGYAELRAEESARLASVLGVSTAAPVEGGQVMASARRSEGRTLSAGEQPTPSSRPKALRLRDPKSCEGCKRSFVPTGANTKRCPVCRREYDLAKSRAYHREHRIPKARDQAGDKNNNWRGGVAPSSYQRIAFDAHGRKCNVDGCTDSDLVVHHRDENRKNNAAGNLEVLCKRHHQLHHNCAQNLPRGPWSRPYDFGERKCAGCADTFKPVNGKQRYCSGRCRTTCT